jgi:predicted RNase H-like HicB family nuclease
LTGNGRGHILAAGPAPVEIVMDYRVVLIESEEGFSISCPSLPGCFSQGATHAEAIENIRSAIQEWLEVEAEMQSDVAVTEEVVSI